MTTPAPCMPGTVPAPTDVPDSAGVPPFPPPGGTTLVTRRDARAVLTANQETDSRGALSRALKEYAEQLSHVAVGGRLIRFERVFAEPADLEENAIYPSACAYAVGEQQYDPNGISPGIGAPGSQLPLPDGRYLHHMSNLVVSMRFEAYANDKEERQAIVLMLEAAFAPVDWMYGFRLDMPHYYGARAVFTPRSAAYDDTEEAAAQRWRRASLTLEARGPVIRLAQLARATYKADVTASVGGDT